MAVSHMNFSEWSQNFAASVSQLIDDRFKEFEKRIKEVEYKAVRSDAGRVRADPDVNLVGAVERLANDVESMRKGHRIKFKTMDGLIEGLQARKPKAVEEGETPLSQLRSEVAKFRLR